MRRPADRPLPGPDLARCRQAAGTPATRCGPCSACSRRSEAGAPPRSARRRARATHGRVNRASHGAVRRPRRVCLLSVHTSPLEQPGTGDAGGMNVYIVETATRMARRGVDVEIFTRATSSDLPPVAELAPGVLVRHVAAGPFEGLGKNDLPSQLCAFTAGVLRTEARHEPGYYDVVHSHYWLSGQVGWLARDRWGVPLVHSAHTLARVKNAALADGDPPEPMVRVIGEDQVVAEADRLIGNTDEESRQLVELYGADPRRTVTVAARRRPGPVHPRRPGGRPARARHRARTPWCSRSSAGSSRSRPRTCCCAPRPSCWRRDPGAALPARRAGGRRPVGQRARRADRAAGAGRLPRASPTCCASSRRRAATAWWTSTAPPTWSPCRATTSRSGSSRWRRRPAARRWWPRASAGCRWPWPTGGPGCSCRGTAPGQWADALAAVALAPGRRAELSAGAVAARP